MEGGACSDIEEPQTFLIRADHGQDVAGESEAIAISPEASLRSRVRVAVAAWAGARSGTDRFRLRARFGLSRGSCRWGRLSTGDRRGRLFRPVAQPDGLNRWRDSTFQRLTSWSSSDTPRAQYRRAELYTPGRPGLELGAGLHVAENQEFHGLIPKLCRRQCPILIEGDGFLGIRDFLEQVQPLGPAAG